MEDRGSRQARGPDSYLRFSTYDARDVIKAAGLSGISLFWQVVLMTWCFNYSPKRVLTNVKGVRADNPMDAADDIIKKVREDRLGADQHGATFTESAIKNLWLLDRLVLAADYRVRVDELADVLDKVDGDMIKDLAEDGRTHMGLALVKLQQVVARKANSLEEMRKLVPYKPEPVVPMSKETQVYLEGIIQEMQTIRRKEKENGLD